MNFLGVGGSMNYNISPKKIAIVGADESRWIKAKIDPFYVESFIRGLMWNLLKEHDPFIFVSGGCPKGGVDIWAEEVADELLTALPPRLIQKAIFTPDENRWTSRGLRWGYKERNLVIAAYSDILYCIDPIGVKSGGNWTIEQAKKIGKEVHRIEL